MIGATSLVNVGTGCPPCPARALIGANNMQPIAAMTSPYPWEYRVMLASTNRRANYPYLRLTLRVRRVNERLARLSRLSHTSVGENPYGRHVQSDFVSIFD